MLDASLEPPYYFDRNIDFSPKVEVEGWTNFDIPKYPLSEDIASYEPLIKDRISVQTKDGLYFLMSLEATDL
jgi:hypothetical protein